jgi:DNA-binding transcriptional LysR family regulator
MLNLDQLRIFDAVAKTRSFTRAAELVHLTQPGISKHVRQMEDYFGLRLFDRTGRKVTLTDAGVILFEATQEIISTIDNAEHRINDLKGLGGGKLRLGSSFPIGVYILPPILAEFRRKYPKVEVAFEICLSDTVESKLIANELDLGLLSRSPRSPKLIAYPFMSDELVLIAPPGHKWATKRRVKPEELISETFIVAAQGAGTRAVMEERLKARGIVLNNILEFGNLEGVKHGVEAGLGVSVQARSVVEREVASGSLRILKLSGIDPKIDFFYASRRSARITYAAKALVELLTTAAV